MENNFEQLDNSGEIQPENQSQDNKKKIWLIVVASVLVTAVVVGVAVYAWQQIRMGKFETEDQKINEELARDNISQQTVEPEKIVVPSSDQPEIQPEEDDPVVAEEELPIEESVIGRNTKTFSYKNGKFILQYPTSFEEYDRKVNEDDIGYVLPKSIDELNKITKDGDYMDDPSDTHQFYDKILSKDYFGAYLEKEQNGKKHKVYQNFYVYVFNYEWEDDDVFYTQPGVSFSKKDLTKRKANIPNGYFTNLRVVNSYEYVREFVFIPMGTKTVGLTLTQGTARGTEFDSDKFSADVEQTMEEILDTVEFD